MRTPADLPRRRRRSGPSGRTWLVVLAVALFVLLTSLRGIAGFYTDFLWFDSLGYTGVFTGVLGAKVILGAIFTGLFFLLMWSNLVIADRMAPRFRPPGPEEEVIERYHEIVGGRIGLVRIGVAALFALIAGAGVSGQWRTWILFTNAQDFGIDDPQFGTDVGFYVFRLPFLTFLVDWAFASFVIILIITAVAHYLNGGIRVQGAAQRVTPAVKGHLSVLLGVLALIKAIDYFLARYELNFSTRGVVRGASYTDVNAQLPALYLLILISLAAFALFIVNIWRRGWVLPVLAVGLWAFVALVVGGAYPAFVQRFRVEPAESSREAPYIERNIAATRAALNLDDVRMRDFAADDALEAADLISNEETVRNIRLWDPGVLIRSFQQNQEIRNFYRVTDVDVDRYEIEGETTQVMISARELDTAGVPQDSWEARQLAFTHGYGAILAPANAKTPDGEPNLLLRNVPVDDIDDIPLEQARIYVGEGLGGYVVVNTDVDEIDYQDAEGQTVTTDYDGADGVDMSSFVRRAAFALRFGDINPLISGNIRPNSKILYQRDIAQRARELAPFLSFDADPYTAVVDGRLQYILDAYTTSNHYPYAEEMDNRGLPAGSGLDHDFSYIRNSVKVVIDAYDGSVTFYVIDDEDPLVAAYRSAFPELFTDGSEIPDEVQRHFRYPEDLFRVQTNMWGRYHITEPRAFYSQADAWDVAPDPGTAGASGAVQQFDQQGRPIGQPREARIDPYYLLMRLPGEEEEEFLMLRPFVPISGEDNSRLLTAFMVAKSDPGSYGELETFVMPRSNLPDGPGIVDASIQADEEVSRLETLLGQEGTQVLFGNLLLIPIEESLLYVRPMYVQPNRTEIPELRKVIVVYDGEVVVEDTLEQSLTALFGDAPETREEDGVDGDLDGEPDDAEPDTRLSSDVAELLAQAQAAFDEAQAALAEGDLGRYQASIEEARRLVAEARRLTQPATTTTTTTEAATA